MPILLLILIFFKLTAAAQPVVNLGKDTLICSTNTFELDAGNPGASYDWSTDETSQTINVYHTGTYSVTVTDSTGAKATDDIRVVFLNERYNEPDNWVFGNGGFIHFKPQPDSIAAGHSFPAGSASISDPNGKLQFYTNGGTIYDKHGNVMMNGEGVAGDPVYGANSIIFPRPTSAIYYNVFTLYPDIGLYYSVVDISKNGGNGEVVEKNILLDPYASDFTAVVSSNDVDIWLIVLNKNSNVFYNYKVGRGKDIGEPEVNQTGPVISGTTQIKVSPEGDKIAVSDGNNVYIYKQFNDKGLIQYVTTIPLAGAQGVEFSRASTYLYVSTNTGQIYSVDVSPLVSDLTPVLIHSQEGAVYGDLQMAHDGNIYVANNGNNCLPQIKSPNKDAYVEIPGMCLMGSATSGKDLPPYPQHYFNMPKGLGLRFADTCQKFPMIISAQYHLDQYDFAKVTYHLDLGDGTAVDTNWIYHAYQDPGTYLIKLTVTSVCGILEREVPVNIDSIPDFTPLPDTTICQGQTVLLNPQAESRYQILWSTGDTSRALNVGQTGVYQMEIKGKYCSARDTAAVTVLNNPVIDLKESDFLCREKKETLTLTSKEGIKFQWLPRGDTTQSITIDSAGFYKVIATGEANCMSADSIIIENICDAELYTPDIFTPNGDQTNDIFTPLGKYVQAYELKIFNRWGELIFVSRSLSEGWDGSYRGSEAEGGAYAYVVVYESKVRDAPNKVLSMSGHFILVK
jgi:gliding motility-associated-like protein